MNAEAGDVYAQQLFPVGFGHPLWRPEPDLKTGREVLVGDVGFIRRCHFTPLFNTTKPATDPINWHKGIPTGFQALSLPDTSISRSDKIMQDMVCSGDVDAVKVEEDIAAAGWRLRSAADAGALVVLDPPAVAEDMIEPRPYIVDYMRENFDSWFQLANVQRGIGLEDHEIIFVCGVLKTTRWGVGAFQREEIRNMEGRVFGQLGVFGDAGFSLDFDRKILPGSHCNTGPSLLGVLREPGVRNQCLFIHYYRMKRRTSWRPLLWLRSRLAHV
ncbi:hypothetical protein LXA43DRAFT_882195 [Ganoderma leucocontextum]|nr:hypothetical protein LXA43DRAFT_882195 [Ganoderma leucocontextum]